jgi:hypothetical protein
VRFVSVDDGGHLDTAITTYRKGDVELRLFGAVHIADAKCYQELNDRFTACDALLYELVADPSVRPRRDQDRGFDPVRLLQQGLRNSVELAFQLDEIDYQAPNFVHADMTPEQFAASMAERGESLLTILGNMLLAGATAPRADADGDSGEVPAPAPRFDLVRAFRSGEGRHLLRLTLAQQLEAMEALSIGGPAGSTLLEGRNEVCLQVLQQELARGRRRLGIYYGAAHLPHLERRLCGDLGFTKVGHEWVVAWDCTKRPDPKFDAALVRQRQRARDELRELGAAVRAYRDGQPTTPASGSEPVVPTPRQLAQAAAGGVPLHRGALQDPWGTDYVVRRRAVGTRWEVASAGQDRQFGTADDLVLAEARRGGLTR